MTAARDGRIATITGAVLTGGASSRMGTDKARLAIAGVPGAVRIASLLAELFEDVLLVGGDPPPAAPGRFVPDPDGPACALRGLTGALDAATTERVLVVATDLPLVTPDLLLALVAWPAAPVVVPRTRGGSHPLCALYRRADVLEYACEQLAAGRLALHTLLDAAGAVYIEPDELARVDPDARALTNVNTPAELADAERWLAETG